MDNYAEYSDKELLLVLKKEKPAKDYAFDVLFRRYSSKLHAYCVFLTKDKEVAKELFHRVWIHFIENVNTGKNVDKILPVLITSSKKIYIDDTRFQKREEKKILEYSHFSETEHIFENNKDAGDTEELLQIIYMAVDSLKPEHKEPFILKRYEGFTDKELSKYYNVSVDCIRKRIERATDEVKEIVNLYINNGKNKG
jgi:RNA polymerase sigma-70 factor, ECF subfamily